MKRRSDDAHKTDYVSKFTHDIDRIFGSLPKPKDWISFATNDLPLLFTADEVQRFAMEQRLNKSQTKAVAKLAEVAPDAFKAIVTNTAADAGTAFTDLVVAATATKPPLCTLAASTPPKSKKERGIEDVRDLSAETISDAAKAIKKERQRKLAIQVDQKFFSGNSTVITHVPPVAAPRPEVKEGEWWKLGPHRLYCGDTSGPDFIKYLPKDAAFAFADPPYGAGVETFDDSQFVWAHDYLADHASIVAVTPGIVSIFELARRTSMPYRWSIACWIANGMTRGALGFGNWIYAALFSSAASLHRNSQDHYRVTISVSETEDTTHKGRKPTAFMTWLIETFTKERQIVIDPFAGSGQTLMCCHSADRSCVTGEIMPEHCNAIVRRWEQGAGREAVRL